MDILKPWLLKDIIPRTKKEGLYILMESADIPIYPNTRAYEDEEGFPRVIYRDYTDHREADKTMIVTATKRDEDGSPNTGGLQLQLVNYEELVNALESYIKEKTPERWKEVQKIDI